MKVNLKRPLVVFDIESTGTDIARDRIIELSMVKLFPDKERESVTYVFNPGIPIPVETSKIHGFYDTDVKDAPFFKDKAQEVFDFVNDSDLGGYNSNRFDVPMLVEEFLRLGMVYELEDRNLVDVFRIFTAMEQRTLEAAYKFYCDKKLENAHSAKADVEATIEVLESQLDRYSDEINNDIDFLHEFTKGGLEYVDLAYRMVYIDGVATFNFGKHKGKPVEDVLRNEPQYYNWIIQNNFSLHTKFQLKKIMLKIKNAK